MKARLFYNLIKWPLTLAVLGGLLALAYFVHAQASEKSKEEQEAEKEKNKPENVPGRVTVMKDIYEVAPALKVKGWSEPVTVYGRVVPNPSRSYEVRAGFAGTLRQGKERWPELGHRVKAGQQLGWVDMRIEPQVRLEMQNKLTEAFLQYQGALEIRAILDTRLKRFEKASKQLPKGFPPRDLEDTRLQLAEARTKESAAESAVFLWAAALADSEQAPRADTSPWTIPLKAPADAQVTHVLAHPGMSVEAGGVMARLVDFRRLQIRLDFPPEALAAGPPQMVALEAGESLPQALRGTRNQPLPGSLAAKVSASLVGADPLVEPSTQLTGYLYEVDSTRQPSARAWRPGRFVRAEVTSPAPVDADAPEAISVPTTALLYHQGRALVYVRLDKKETGTTFARREVQMLGRQGNRWILATGGNVAAGAQVVVANAQMLLAQEFNAETDND